MPTLRENVALYYHFLNMRSGWPYVFGEFGYRLVSGSLGRLLGIIDQSKLRRDFGHRAPSSVTTCDHTLVEASKLHVCEEMRVSDWLSWNLIDAHVLQ